MSDISSISNPYDQYALLQQLRQSQASTSAATPADNTSTGSATTTSTAVQQPTQSVPTALLSGATAQSLIETQAIGTAGSGTDATSQTGTQSVAGHGHGHHHGHGKIEGDGSSTDSAADSLLTDTTDDTTSNDTTTTGSSALPSSVNAYLDAQSQGSGSGLSDTTMLGLLYSKSPGVSTTA